MFSLLLPWFSIIIYNLLKVHEVRTNIKKQTDDMNMNDMIWRDKKHGWFIVSIVTSLLDKATCLADKTVFV
jgi:hypothetical protein